MMQEASYIAASAKAFVYSTFIDLVCVLIGLVVCVCVRVCVCVCVYVCMYVCMYVCVYSSYLHQIVIDLINVHRT